MKQILILFIAFMLLSTISVQSEIISVRVSPENITLAPGQTCRFTAQGIDSFFGNMNIRPIWVVEGQGRITPDGIYTAGYNVNGMDIVKAIYPGRRIHGVSKVFIRHNHITPYPPHPGYVPPRPPHPGYVPPRPPHPGFNQPKPGFNQPRPGFNQPRPGFNQPRPGFNQPRPGFNQPRPGFNQPTPGYNQPRPKFNK